MYITTTKDAVVKIGRELSTICGPKVLVLRVHSASNTLHHTHI